MSTLNIDNQAANIHDEETEKRLQYRHPLTVRYASREMAQIWSEHTKYTTWRVLWIALARAEMELGVANITEEKLRKLEQMKDTIDYKEAMHQERKLRHDVMAHIHTFGKQVPEAMGILHLGATSCYVTDNGDLYQQRLGLDLIKEKLARLMNVLAETARKYKSLPTLGFTHFQPAQVTTVGKRMTLWLQDFLMDYMWVDEHVKGMMFRGVKGTTGTQASFLELFNGDHDKVDKLNERVAQLMGFDRIIPVSGQTYTRKLDSRLLQVVAGIGESAHKMCTDIRLLASMKEIEEPFGKTQVGSSAMPYKRNPMRSERACALSKYLMNLPKTMADTHSTQWFERTLDDSAIRRMVIPEAFLACDAILDVCANIINGIIVWDRVIEKHLMAELPFMATENILMRCVQAGGDRQELHEIIRVHSMEAGAKVKTGEENDLLERIKKDPHFDAVKDSLDAIVDPTLYIGRCPEQVKMFCSEYIDPILASNADALSKSIKDLKV